MNNQILLVVIGILLVVEIGHTIIYRHQHKRLYFHCKALCISIMEDRKYFENSGSMPVSGETVNVNGSDVHELITSSLKRWIKRNP